MPSLFSQSFPPKSKFNASDIPDLTDRVMIVTGANTGIGYENAKALLAKHAKVYIACRNADKAEAAIQKLKSETIDSRGQAIFLKLDLSSFKSIKAAAVEFQSKETHLDVLFNNAGVMFPPIDQVTQEGYDMQFGTNVIGTYLLTRLLIPSLKSAAHASPGIGGRVVTDSSLMHLFSPQHKLHFDTFKDGPERLKMSTTSLYSQSKAGDVVIAKEFARRYADQGIVSISLNPGNISTDLTRHLPSLAQILNRIFISHPVVLGAVTQLYAGTSPECASYNGEYLEPWARLGKPDPWTHDEKVGKALWEWLEEQTKEYL